MANGQGKVAENKSEIVAKLPRACCDETAAVEFMESERWKDSGPCCPHCGAVNVYKMTDRKTGQRNKRFLWKCNECGKQYSVRVGTVFEDSRIPLRHWCYGFWAAAASKKGVSSKQIQRMTGLSYKSALFLMHRIRFAMRDDAAEKPKLSGIVEADETYVGGKPRNKQKGKGPIKGWLQTRKTPVVSLVQRDGNIRSFVTADVTSNNLARILRENIAADAHLMTDSSVVYRSHIVRSPFAKHDMTNHRAGEYARPGGIHSNTVESAFSLLKRGVYGTFHNVSRKHLHRYVSEFDFRWNARKMDDGARTALAIRSANGKRLTYADQIGRVSRED